MLLGTYKPISCSGGSNFGQHVETQGPPLACAQRNEETSSEDSTELKMDTEIQKKKQFSPPME
jgi:hypothetical protein